MLKDYKNIKLIDQTDNDDLFNLFDIKIIRIFDLLNEEKISKIDFIKESPLIQGKYKTCNVDTLEKIVESEFSKVIFKDNLVLFLGTRFEEKIDDEEEFSESIITYPYVTASRIYNSTRYFLKTHSNITNSGLIFRNPCIAVYQ